MKKIAKAELHCHLEGIIDPEMLEHFENKSKNLPISAKEFKNYYPVNSFNDFIAWTKAQDAFQGSIINYLDILAIHMERLKKQNVIYTEIQFAPSELPLNHNEALAMMREFTSEVHRYENQEIQVEFLCSIARQATPAKFEFVTERLCRLHEAGLVQGLNIVGFEKNFPLNRYQSSLERLKDRKIPISVHAGEWAGPESVWNALQCASPRRIGHGVTSFQDKNLIAEIINRNIHIEFCPTSNLKTGSINDIMEHPVCRANNLGVSFSLSTDDPGPFECTIESEYQLLMHKFNFSEDQLKALTSEALQNAFAREFRISPNILKAFYTPIT
jgi:adenosine deaminase